MYCKCKRWSQLVGNERNLKFIYEYANVRIIRMATNTTKVGENVLYPELSYIITGILFGAHNELGQFAREKQYGDSIEGKLKESKIIYRREVNIDGGNILDFIIDDKIILEIKAVRIITKDNYRQIQNYLQQTGLRLGILVNFKNKYVKPIRIIRIHS